MSEDYELIITETALADTQRIYKYISKHLKNTPAANKLRSKFIDAFQSLTYMPERNPACQLSPYEKLLHRVLISNYYIYYLIEKEAKTVSVIRIMHTKQNVTLQDNR